MSTAVVEKRVDTLRRAAEKARTLADAATPGPWRVAPWDHQLVMPEAWVMEAGDPRNRPPFVAIRATDSAEHVASWHPDVARSVADMLEEFARLDDQGIHPPTAVVTLAKRYLGETS